MSAASPAAAFRGALVVAVRSVDLPMDVRDHGQSAPEAVNRSRWEPGQSHRAQKEEAHGEWSGGASRH
jgi:hypothetical protein